MIIKYENDNNNDNNNNIDEIEEKLLSLYICNDKFDENRIDLLLKKLEVIRQEKKRKRNSLDDIIDIPINNNKRNKEVQTIMDIEKEMDDDEKEDIIYKDINNIICPPSPIYSDHENILEEEKIYDAELETQQKIKPVLQELNNYFEERTNIGGKIEAIHEAKELLDQIEEREKGKIEEKKVEEYKKAKIKADKYKQLLVCPDGIFDKNAWKQKKINEQKRKVMARLDDICSDFRMRVKERDDYLSELVHIEKELKNISFDMNEIMNSFLEPISIYDTNNVAKNMKILVSSFRKSRKWKRLFKFNRNRCRTIHSLTVTHGWNLIHKNIDDPNSTSLERDQMIEWCKKNRVTTLESNCPVILTNWKTIKNFITIGKLLMINSIAVHDTKSVIQSYKILGWDEGSTFLKILAERYPDVCNDPRLKLSLETGLCTHTSPPKDIREWQDWNERYNSEDIE